MERIFIENRIYRDIEEVETWEGVLESTKTRPPTSPILELVEKFNWVGPYT